MTICELTIENAQDFLSMQLQLDTETNNMMFEPGERANDINNVHRNIENNKRSGSSVFLAYIGDKCVGFLIANRGSMRRIRHTAYIVISILQAHRGKGVGSALFDNLMIWAEKNTLKRLELTVMTHNNTGIQLYKKHGFEIEGTKKCAMLVNQHYVDEYYMAKILHE